MARHEGPKKTSRDAQVPSDAWKRIQGPRRLGPHTIDAPGGKSETVRIEPRTKSILEEQRRSKKR